MRSSEPMPENPWPHDMGITVEDRPNALLELLWIREAYGLRTGGPNTSGTDLPPLLSDAPTVVHDRCVTSEMREEWEDAWPRIWRAAAAHAGRETDQKLFESLSASADGSAERARALSQLIGPTWRDEFGGDALDDTPGRDSYNEWSRRGTESHRASMLQKMQNSPERRDLGALIPAWRAGLTKVVTIPCSGLFSTKISTHALLMTDEVRDNSADYVRALNGFV